MIHFSLCKTDIPLRVDSNRWSIDAWQIDAHLNLNINITITTRLDQCEPVTENTLVIVTQLYPLPSLLVF